MDVIPSCWGPVCWTCDMAEMFVCICGSRVEEQEQVLGSKTALRCGYDGCETSWVSITFSCIPTMYWQFHLACFNFTCAPKNWHCENDSHSKKWCDYSRWTRFLVFHAPCKPKIWYVFFWNCLFESNIAILGRRGRGGGGSWSVAWTNLPTPCRC